MIVDTDHIAPGQGDALWAWKAFLRGHHPILMDFGIIGGVNPADPKAGGDMAFEAFEPARFAMGDTVRLAERVGLIDMEPRRDLGSTGYVLANPGVEYLALQPEPGEPFTLTVEPGWSTSSEGDAGGRRGTTRRRDAASDVDHRAHERGELPLVFGRRVEPRTTRLGVLAGAHADLARVRRRLPDDGRDLLEVEPEHVVQQEHRPFDRRQRLEHHEERDRQRLEVLGLLLGRRLGVGDDRLREPRPDVALPSHPRRAQVVDREPRRDLGEERLRLPDLAAVERAAGARAGTSPARCPRRRRPHPPCGGDETAERTHRTQLTTRP